MMISGVLAFGFYAGLTAVKRKYNFIDMLMFFFILSIGVIFGSHLLYALVHYKNTFNELENIKQKNIISAIGSIFGGRTFYGGLIGALVLGWFVILKDKNYIKYFDIIALGIPLFHFFAKIGCFLAGCCYGIESKIGFKYIDNHSAETDEIIRLPVQLLESFFCIILFFYLNYLFIKNKFENKLIYLYLLIYSAGRFFIEYLRGDASRGIWFHLSTSQIISILIILFILISSFIFYNKHKNNKRTDII
ncbi:MAG: prolipoprotein diacylglyceryl transferase [Treponema sp.]|nr:prolipoprotein diacylglyceryl transferase [Treponema sp.]